MNIFSNLTYLLSATSMSECRLCCRGGRSSTVKGGRRSKSGQRDREGREHFEEGTLPMGDKYLIGSCRLFKIVPVL